MPFARRSAVPAVPQFSKPPGAGMPRSQLPALTAEVAAAHPAITLSQYMRAAVGYVVWRDLASVVQQVSWDNVWAQTQRGVKAQTGASYAGYSTTRLVGPRAARDD